MTEIKIEKKKPVWPWILLVLVILAVAVYFLFFKNSGNRLTPPGTDSTAMMTMPAQNNDVTSYIDYVKGDTSKMALDHTYSSTALSKLIMAVQEKAGDVNYDIKADMDQANDYAREITADPMATNHADKIKAAADIISTSLGNMQQAKFSSLSTEAADVKTAADGIKPEILTLDQKEAVQRFFDKAADLLQKMN